MRILCFFAVLCALPASAQVVAPRDCRRLPEWVGSAEFNAVNNFNKSRIAFSTNEQRQTGIVLIELPDPSRTAIEHPPARVYQHPTWLAAGNMGAIATDERGNVYAAPAPRINLLGNKPDDQNKLWRIDTRSQTMSVVADLPKARAVVAAENPFGIMGLVYDCTHRGIFATSLSGSDHDHEAGRIFSLRLQPTNRVSGDKVEIIDTIPATDAIGIGIVMVDNQARVFFGKARTSDIYSVAVDEAGHFIGTPRIEASLAGFGPRGDDRARKIRFNEAGEMVVQSISFFYNLSNPPQGNDTTYTFRYDALRHVWQLAGMQ